MALQVVDGTARYADEPHPQPLPHRGRGAERWGFGRWLADCRVTILRCWRNCGRYPLPNSFSHFARAVPVPLRTLVRPAREGAERWQLVSMDDGRFCICRFAGCWLPPPRPSPTGEGAEWWRFGWRLADWDSGGAPVHIRYGYSGNESGKRSGKAPSPAGRSPQRAGTHSKCVRILNGARGRVGVGVAIARLSQMPHF